MTPILLAWLCWLPYASAQQLTESLDLSSGAYTSTWKVPQVGRSTVSATLPATTLADPGAIVVRQRKVDLYQEIADQMQAWAKTERIRLRTKATPEGLSLGFSYADGEKKETEKKVEAAREAAYQRVLAENGFIENGEDEIVMDHARFAVERAPDVADLAAKLMAGLPENDPRARIQTALNFVQSIPYKRGGARSVQLPLGVLSHNNGDCDSKSLLLLALLRTATPEVRTVIVYVPHHAFVGVGIPSAKGDATLKWNDTEWVLVEPAGPAVVPVGEIGDETHKLLRKDPDLVREVGR